MWTEKIRNDFNRIALHEQEGWEHPVLADRPALRRTLREQTRSLGLYKQNPPTRVSESPRRRTKVCVAAISNRPVFLPKVDAPRRMESNTA
ncbi:MAG: hypothetical protein V7L26_29075 [Nostoc sp.]|uniref:hypothetical protein n=1 Tax=Nostoc sp. TaxID=1180 RepID=UPI002FFB2832